MSNRGFLPELLSPCEEPHLVLNQLVDGTDRLKIPFQDEDYSGNDSHLVPAFQRLCSRMFRHGPGLCPYLWVLVNFLYFRQSTQDAGLCLLLISRTIFQLLCVLSLKDLSYVVLIDSKNGRVY